MVDILSDGQWHEREAVVQAAIPLVPPGRAMRWTERDRQRGRQAPGERRVPRSPEFQLRVGARAICFDALGQLVRVEKQVVDGKVMVRRLDA